MQPTIPPTASEISNYIANLYVNESPAMTNARKKAEIINRPIHISPEEGKLLATLIFLHGGKKILELGTLTGYSTLWIASALPAGGIVHSIDHNDDCIEIARQNICQARLTHKITLHKGKILEVLPKLQSEASFDVIFIDAMKREYPEYLAWVKRLLKPGGMLIADNTLLSGSVAVPPHTHHPHLRESTLNAVKAFNRSLAEDESFHSIIIPTKEGLSIAIYNG